MYDDVRFEPLSEKRDGKYFLITLDHPCQSGKWALTTERYGFGTPEFVCGNVREMLRYVDKLGAELEKEVPGPLTKTPSNGFRKASGTSQKKRRERER